MEIKLTESSKIETQSTLNQERRDPHLRNGSKSDDQRFHPFQDKSFIKKQKKKRERKNLNRRPLLQEEKQRQMMYLFRDQLPRKLFQRQKEM